MLHEHIKDLARRSMATDRVLFGESKRRHPLGFEGFNIDLSLDKALLQLNSASYDSATAFQLECNGILGILRESMNVEVSSNISRLYKEGKVANAIKKVIAFIKKAIKFIFIDLPKKIYAKIKALFSKKGKDVNFTKKTDEAIKKGKESVKKTSDELNAKVNEALKASAPTESAEDFTKWKQEMLDELSGIGKRMDATSNAEADRVTDDLIKTAYDAREKGMKDVTPEDAYDELQSHKAKIGKRMMDRHGELRDAMYSLNETMNGKGDEKTEKTKSNMDGQSLKGDKTYSKSDKIGADLDDLLESLSDIKIAETEDDTPPLKGTDLKDAELKKMADDLIRALKENKLHIDIETLKNFNYKTFDVWSTAVQNWGGSEENVNNFLVLALIRSINGIPYINEHAAKYVNKKYGVEIMIASKSATSEKGIYNLLGTQLRSFAKLKGGLGHKSHADIMLTVMHPDFIKSLTDAMTTQFNADAVRNLSEGTMTKPIKSEPSMVMVAASTAFELAHAISSIDDTVKKLGNTPIEEFGESAEDINKKLSEMTDLTNAVVQLNQKIAVHVLKCLDGVAAAEGVLIRDVIKGDDAYMSLTMGQLARYIARDTHAMREIRIYMRQRCAANLMKDFR